VVQLKGAELEWLQRRAEKRGTTVDIEAGLLLRAHVGSRRRGDEKERARLDECRRRIDQTERRR
jgi:hypothetical protein